VGDLLTYKADEKYLSRRLSRNGEEKSGYLFAYFDSKGEFENVFGIYLVIGLKRIPLRSAMPSHDLSAVFAKRNPHCPQKTLPRQTIPTDPTLCDQKKLFGIFCSPLRL